MLERIVIDGYQRIAEADMDLSSHRIHAVTGDNEAGKSSLIEAIAFCIRGLSPRVKLKGQFEELLFRGKKKGSVHLVMDGFDLDRNIKTGKLETTAPLDYHELLVDLQLGREPFGRAEAKDLRQMMSKTFGVESSTKYISERLEKKGVTTEMIDRIIPLLKAGGFEAASDTAKTRYLEKRGAWEQVTGEKYGSVKAEDWTPADAGLYMPVAIEDIGKAKDAVQAAKQAYALANQALGALSKAAETSEAAEQLESVEGIETHLQSLVDVEATYSDELVALRQKLEAELKGVDDEAESLRAEILKAKMDVVTLECPDCNAALRVQSEGDRVSLVKIDGAKRRAGVSLSTLTDQLNEAQALRKDLVQARTAKIHQLEKTLMEVRADGSLEAKKLETAKFAATVEKVSPEDIIKAQEKAEQAGADHETAKEELVRLESTAFNHASVGERTKRAAELSKEAAQWSLASDLLSNKPDSIPSELVQRTVGPINDTLMKICSRWGQLPIVVDGSMGVSRGDGCRYYMLSESAKWRADVAIQLALAALGPLKMVAIDRFDVLSPSARGALFDMLEWFSEQHKDVTVIMTGTLKSKPELGDSIKSWWIQDGEVTE